MKRLVVLVVALAAAGALFVLYSSKKDSRGDARVPGAAPSERAAAESPADLVAASPPEPAPAPDAGTTPAAVRESRAREPLAGIVRGLAPGAAELTWTALLPELEGVLTPTAIDFDRLREASVTATSDAAGRFTFPAIPPGALELGSVVWITQQGREASSVALAAGDAAWRWPATLDASARDAVRVVVKRAGEPIAGASVRQTISFWEAGQSEEEKRERRVFLREARTGPDGSVLIVPGSGQNLVSAWSGDERALPWIGEPEQELVLELLPTIEVSGRVLVNDATLDFDEVRYTVGFFNVGDGSDALGGGPSIRVHADGSFGPDRWPRPQREQLQVYVRGGELVPARTVVPNPPAGGRVSVDIVSARGYPFAVAVATKAGEPVAAAAIDAWHWSSADAEGLPLARTFTDGNGRASLFSAAGDLRVDVSKPGFTTWSLSGDARTIVPQMVAPLEVVLRPAGVVEGLVHCGSEPVKRFTVLAWNDGQSYSITKEFSDDEGAFELDDVPKGESVHLLAYSEAQPQSDTAVIVLAEEPVEVDLELPKPRRARGRVIDAVTREPVPTARIQHTLAGMQLLAGFRGKELPVQPDGRFELDGFFPGRGGFACTAEGYDGLYYSTREDDSDVIDVGLLALKPMTVLEVEVRERGVSDFSAYTAWNVFNPDNSPQPLASDGSLEIPSRVGNYQLQVARPNGDTTRAIGSILPGERKRVVVDLSGGIELAVLLAEAPARVESWSLAVCTRSREADHCTKARWSAEREAFVVRPLEPGDAVLELRDAEGKLVTQRSVRLSDAPQQTLTLSIGGVRRRLRLVDGHAHPWAARPVTVTLGDASGWSAFSETDAAGEIEIGPLDARHVVLSTKLGNESIAYGVGVELEPDPARTTVVELEVGPRSLLRLMELGRPMAGLDVVYTHELGPRALTFGYTSDEAGLVRGPFLGPGTYTVLVSHPDFWPQRFAVTSRSSTDPVPVELHSRATLEIEVTTLGGRALPGARLELAHPELGESVEDWLAAGMLDAPAGLVTDAEGRLVLAGVPRGTYAWSCVASGCADAAGEFPLAPREHGTLRIRMREE